jgi:MFS transporter, DHA2 family, multidrug resistance protein
MAVVGESAGNPATPAKDEGHPHRWSILVALCAALAITVVDNTVLSVALPAIAVAFDAGTAALQAVVDAYVVVFAGLLVAAGVVADRFVRRRALLVGLSVFGVASAIAAAAGTVEWLIAMRAAMGIGAALVMPATLAIMVHVFPVRERPRAFGVWAAVAAVAMAAGPVLGGFLVSAWGWAAVFLVNLPVAALALVGAAILVPESRDPCPGRLDLLSAGLFTVGMLGLILALVVAGESGPDEPPVVLGAVLAVVGLLLFAWRQRRSSAPMVDFSLYRDRTFAGASAAAALLTLGTGSALFVLTQYLQLVLGLTPMLAGAAMAPLALGVVAGSTAGGRAPARIGMRWSIVAGFLLVVAGFVVLVVVGAERSYPPVAIGLVLLGLGAGFSSPAVTSAVLNSVPPDRAGMGSALNDTHQQLGVGVGVAVLGTVLAAAYRAELPTSVPEGAGASLSATLSHVGGGPSGAHLAEVARAAFTSAQALTMGVAACCAFAGAAIAFVVLPADRPRRDRPLPASASG